MKRVAFFDAKPYDHVYFDKHNKDYEITYFEAKLTPETVSLAQGFDAIVPFVNDVLNREVIDKLYELGIHFIALRQAGYNNIDMKACYKKIYVARVPAYSPYAVAEHAMALLLTLNRKIHKAYNRTRDFNFNINGFRGMDLHDKVVGVIGTGRIGKIFINICRGFGMHVIAYDAFPDLKSDIEYVSLDELYQRSHVISLHCPLTDETKHIINKEALSKMRDGVFIVNTSRGGLIDSEALLEALNTTKVRGAGLDVYEEEGDIFYEDNSDTIILDDTLSLLVSKPNVILTSHQGFLTDEALENIALITLKNLDEYFAGGYIENEICYYCDKGKAKDGCRKNKHERCF